MEWPESLTLQMPLYEVLLRGVGVYLLLMVIVRVIPKRHTGNLSPNDLLAMIVVGDLAGSAMLGETKSIIDIMLMLVIVLGLDYALNLLEYYAPRVRDLAQDTPTLLIHNGSMIKANLEKEKLTEQELCANLRKHGIADIQLVRQAVLEVDGHISVIRRDE